MSEGELILYATEDGAAEIQLRAIDGAVWLSQVEMAELFQTTKQNVSLHVRNILAEGELSAEATVKEYLTVQTEGARQVKRTVTLYRLEMILAVGYRVRSPRGTQFRRWATSALKEYLVKGFVMNDARLKEPGFDYFDELLERIRDIRASEARFYQKVRDILALSEDYDPQARVATEFYAKIQNKMLFAVSGHTAGELIRERADASAPNMGLTTWKGADHGRGVRKADVATAKNYLGEAEIKDLNQIVTMFLDTAELRARRRQTMRLGDWESVLDTFLTSNELPLLRNAGTVSAKQAEAIAHARYAEFDAKRREAERAAAEQVDDLAELQRIAEASKGRKKGARMLNEVIAEASRPSAYKETKIGKLPSNWKVVSLEDVADPSATIRYGVVQIGPDTPDGVPIVPIKHIRRINDATLHRASPDIEAAYAGSRVKGGDVLISVKGTIGEVGVVPAGFEGNIAREIARIRPTANCDADFLSFQLQADHTQRRIDSKVVGSTRLEFSIHAVKDFLIALPPLPEQRKIAEILRTWDEAIEKLEALRAAKRDHLTGLQQALLGRGGAFPGHWERRPLSSICTRVRRQNGGGDHPVMTISAKSGFLMQSDKFSRDMAGSSVERYMLLHEGEFVYNKGNSLTAPYGCIFPLDRPTALVPFVYFCFALNRNMNRDFYTHLFAAGALNHQLSRLINSGVRNDGLLNLNVDDFFGCKVPIPPRKEQEKIAAALTAAKSELALLDKQIESLTRQKRGLMQKLLTGEWRVNVGAG